jgi:hypothetical protein
MTNRLMLILARLLIRTGLCLPLVAFALFGWQSCADAALSAPSMVAVDGRLLHLRTLPTSRNTFTLHGKEVDYVYRFGQREYQGHAAMFCSTITTASQIDPMQEMYAELEQLLGKTVTVWVDPVRPENAVLFRYVPRAAIIMLGTGFVFLFVWLIKLDQYLSRRLRQRFRSPWLFPHS